MAIEVYPSIDGWATARTDEIRLTTDNCQLILPKKINKINKVLLDTGADDQGRKMSVMIRYQDSTLDIKTDFVNVSDIYQVIDGNYVSLKNIDITPLIVENSTYLLLPYKNNATGALVGLNKNNTWAYQHNDNKIILDNETVKNQVIFTTPKTRIIIAAALLRMETLYIEDDYGEKVAITEFLMSSTPTPPTQSPFYLRFRVYYEPMAESVKVETPKTAPQEKEFSIPYSQTQPIVSSSSFGKTAKATANRTGVETRTVCRKCKYLNQIRKIGSIWREKDSSGNRTGDIWRLTAQDIEFNCGYAYTTEVWSKNWFYQSEYVGINREFRSWNIPNDILKRTLHVVDNCYITSNLAVHDDINCLLSDEAKREVLRSLESTRLQSSGVDVPTEGNLMYLGKNATGGTFDGVLLGCSAVGEGNNLLFTAKTNDNLTAGSYRYQNAGDSNTYCADANYSTDGVADTMYLAIGSTFENGNTDKYPVSNESENTLTGDCQVINIANGGVPLQVKKGTGEQVLLTYQIALQTHEPDLVIGSGWAANCPLVKQRDAGYQVVWWQLSADCPKGMETMTTAYGTTTPTPRISVDAGKGTFTIQPHTCLTDAARNIIVAYNGDTAKTFALKWLHSYRQMDKWYKNAFGNKYRDATF